MYFTAIQFFLFILIINNVNNVKYHYQVSVINYVNNTDQYLYEKAILYYSVIIFHIVVLLIVIN
jgi:hypothetical protein